MDRQQVIGTIGKWVALGVVAVSMAACGEKGSGGGAQAASAPSKATASSASGSGSASSTSSSTETSSSSSSFSSSSSSISGTSTTASVTLNVTPQEHKSASTGPVVTQSEEPAAEEPANEAPVSEEPAPAPANHAPTISGAPMTALNVGGAYSFTPAASDADGDALSFSIQNKPSWASFSIATGKLTGTPGAGDVSTYSNIVIGVSDGKSSAQLAAFSIDVTQISNGRVTLSWLPPTQNTDGSTLTTLSGYKIVYGTSATALNQTITVNNAGLTTYLIENLSPGTYYFAVKAVSSTGAESDKSGVASKTIS